MATRRYGISVGESFSNVTEAAGAATAADHIEITIDNAITTVGKAEIVRLMRVLEAAIVMDTYPPA